MTSARKGTRITIYCAILMMHIIVMMEIGSNFISHFTTKTARPLLRKETRQNTRKQQRRILRQRNISSEQIIDDKSGQRRNDFLNYFEDSFTNNATSIDAATSTSASNFAALILRKDKIYCRKSQMEKLSRSKYFVQMLRQGLMQKKPPQEAADTKVVSTSDNGFPILIKHDDSNGCYPATRKDKYGFPRLTWSIPANATRDDHQLQPQGESSWCSAIGMPSYKTWKDLNHHDKRIQKAFQTNKSMLYPWSAKLPKAVWRGATTCNKGLYGHLPLEDIPRSKLVESSLERPDLIDAGFHKFVGKYEENASSRMLKEAIPLEEMMKYKAIIDIDGNNWSARFHTLLCTNSIVIKIAPDFIEQYYHELEPNVHYLPASLDNLTQVVEYVMEDGNDMVMEGIVEKANEWCRGNRGKEWLALKAMAALEMYRGSLERYDGGRWMEEWKSGRVLENVDDLVECNV